MIFVDRVGENVIAVLPGANAAMTAADAHRALGGHAQAIVLLQQEIPQAATEQALQLARRQGLTTILNTATLLATKSRIAPLATIIVANESEFTMLHGARGMPLQAAMVDWAVFHARVGVFPELINMRDHSGRRWISEDIVNATRPFVSPRVVSRSGDHHDFEANI